VGTAPSDLVCLFVCFVILVFTAAGSEPTEIMALVSVVLESTGVDLER
jgi:hypothetical protein